MRKFTYFLAGLLFTTGIGVATLASTLPDQMAIPAFGLAAMCALVSIGGAMKLYKEGKQ